ncbi:site-2 protease family protein [Natrarchaeobius sp. A-rgal3]|uniref:site-2 protease family protein n=1 Tax=Natrarchaeobius versutus TaxID=1679078 RepID=UPI0035108A82
MRETVLLVGVGLLAYTAVAMALAAWGRLPGWIRIRGPMVTFETEATPSVLDRLATRRRLWRRIADAGVFVSFALVAVSFVMVVFAGYAALTREVATEVNRPRNVLAVPGVNDFLPLSATPEIVFGLFAGVAVHELGHALLARVEDVDVRSMGVIFLALVPFGAYVDMGGDERSVSTAARNRIYAAGVTVNLVLAIVCALVLMALVSASVAAVPGLAVGTVVPGTPAADAGLERGDVITAVDGTPVEDEAEVRAELADADETVSLERAEGESVTLERAVVVRAAPGAGPNALEPGTEIAAVDGTPVRAEAAFREALEAADEPTVAVTTVDSDGVERAETFVAGTYVASVVEDGPLADAGAPTGEPGVVTSIDGERMTDHEDLFAALEAASPGETVIVGLYTDDGLEEYRVTLGESTDGDGAHLGVYPAAGAGGIAVTDLGIEPYPTDEHLGVLSGSEPATITNTPLDRLLTIAFLPFAGAIGLASENFGGFVGEATAVYAVTGPLSAVGGVVFVLATVLYWTGWISLLLGFFNCLPVYPLDGGRLVRTNAEGVASRLPVSTPGTAAAAVTAVSSAVVLISVVVMLFGPMVLGT